MQVRKFEAPTLQEALDTIKKELGPEAVILQTKRAKKGFGFLAKGTVEVTAAVSERSISNKKSLDIRLPNNTRTAIQDLPADRQAKIYQKHEVRSESSPGRRRLDQAASAIREKIQISRKKKKREITKTPYIDIDSEEVQKPTPAAKPAPAPARAPVPAQATARRDLSVVDEVKQLKQMISDLRRDQEEREKFLAKAGEKDNQTFDSEATRTAFDQLVVNGVDRNYALGIIQDVMSRLNTSEGEDRDQVAEEVASVIMSNTEVTSILPGIKKKRDADRRSPPTKIALVGPTGVGKTTTLAKIASEAVRTHGLKLGLINIDTYRVGARDQLSTYARLIKVPVRTVSDESELKTALGDFGFCDLILIDTTGTSQKDSEGLLATEKILQTVPDLRTELVLSATTRDVELYSMAKRFSSFKPESVIFSKLDEGMIFGSIYNVSRRIRTPLSFFTTGQRVPDDLEEATKERLAALILEL